MLFVEPGEDVYEGMIVGENARAEDLDVNAVQGEAPHQHALLDVATCWSGSCRRGKLSLDQALEFVREDECVEVTPHAVRLRKVELESIARVKAARARARA